MLREMKTKKVLLKINILKLNVI